MRRDSERSETNSHIRTRSININMNFRKSQLIFQAKKAQYL